MHVPKNVLIVYSKRVKAAGSLADALWCELCDVMPIGRLFGTAAAWKAVQDSFPRIKKTEGYILMGAVLHVVYADNIARPSEYPSPSLTRPNGRRWIL